MTEHWKKVGGRRVKIKDSKIWTNSTTAKKKKCPRCNGAGIKPEWNLLGGNTVPIVRAVKCDYCKGKKVVPVYW
jgi:DnaJ-class molecular chaperone